MLETNDTESSCAIQGGLTIARGFSSVLAMLRFARFGAASTPNIWKSEHLEVRATGAPQTFTMSEVLAASSILTVGMRISTAVTAVTAFSPC